jgi:hypothetical protein
MTGIEKNPAYGHQKLKVKLSNPAKISDKSPTDFP